MRDAKHFFPPTVQLHYVNSLHCPLHYACLYLCIILGIRLYTSCDQQRIATLSETKQLTASKRNIAICELPPSILFLFVLWPRLISGFY